ncbi:MAG: AAA family ATPase [Maricaulis sp.]|uniref:YhaN family protein n=1 Tax=Maricaulis sp. TaxID=1486257 RepID=UPI001B095B8B|nr:YhaN family protein [Maricaulis sp.]MBO6848775.1 AAA family ATPase [Maricaulis sp.]MBO6878378.1 AAA family ATPase [Maricaulis sp.]
MRIRRLDLLLYGHFTERSLELPAGTSDFHIIFGPNEAGKSTALSAIEDLLFGIHGQTPYGFLHDYSSMRIGAVLEGDSDELEVLRRKGNKDTLLGPEGVPVPGGEAVLRPYLAGADRTFFERMFSLDHTRLEAGGREILEAKGDVGQMLFSAGAGIGGLREQLSQLTGEADELWSARRAQHRKFYIAKDKFTKATTELGEQTLSAAKWRERKEAYEEAEEAYGNIDNAISDATTSRNRLSRIRRVFRDVQRKQQLDRLLEEIGDVIALPEDAAAIVAESKRKDAEAAARVGTLTEQLQRANDALEKLTYDETIIQRAADVRQACERRIEIRAEKADLPKLETELHATERKLKDDAAELGWRDGNSTGLTERIPPRPNVSVVRSLLNQKGELESDVSSKARLLEEATEEHSGLKDELAEVDEPVDASRMGIVLKSVREQGDIAGRVRSASEGLKNARSRVARRLGALDPGVDDEAALTGMRVPARAKVQAQREEQDDWQRRLTEMRQRAASVQQELDGALAALERAISDEQVVTADEMKDARGRRDVVWQLVKIKHIKGQPIPPDQAAQYKAEIKDLAGAFEPAVLRADDLADRRFDHAEAAGRIAEIKRKTEEQETLLGQVYDNEKKLLEEGKQLKADWAALWAGAPFEPEAPETMLEWLEGRDGVQEAIEARDEANSLLEAVRGEEQAARQQLIGGLASLGVDVGTLETDDLPIVVEQAAEELRLREAEADKRSGLENEVAEAGKLVVRRQREFEAAKNALAEWHDKWTAALGELGLAVDTAATAVDAQIGIIDQMRETAGRINSLRHDRIEKIQRDVADFENVVSQLVQVVAPDFADKAADDAVAALETRLNESEKIRGLREKLGEDIEGLKEQINTLEGQRREIAVSISHLKQAAGVDDNDLLESAIEWSDNRRRLCKERQKITEKLQQDGDGKTVDELAAECEGLAIDDVAAREASLQAELEDLRKQQSEAGDVRSQARQAFQAIGGDDAAAQAGAAREEALTEMGEVAERYVRVKTSAILLQWAIDRYRREMQAPLLKRAGQLFQVMTAGSFTSLRVDFDDQDNAYLTGVRPDESVVPVSGMSTGTADQLYLALRVASIEDYLERAEALPFVADDLFINFDDHRAAAGIQLLGQLAESTQVLFFTHHQHLVEIAKATLGASVNYVSLEA